MVADLVTECQRCGGRAQLFLCPTDIADLRQMLAEIPRLAAYLDDSAFGQTKLGEPARRTKSDETPMRVNFRASRELTQLHATLGRWVQDMCETRGMPIPEVMAHSPGRDPAAIAAHSRAVVTTATMARWMAHNVNAIAATDDAGLCYREIDRHVTRIMRIINRPSPPRFCGPCPTETAGLLCDTRLMAHRGASDVKCPVCHEVHSVAELLADLWERIEHMSFTSADVLLVFGALDRPLSPRTWRQWRFGKRIMPSGWADGEPLYRISDVRELADGHARRPAMT